MVSKFVTLTYRGCVLTHSSVCYHRKIRSYQGCSIRMRSTSLPAVHGVICFALVVADYERCGGRSDCDCNDFTST